MSGIRKRVLRKRLWAGEADEDGERDDRASARNVGENLRNVDSAIGDLPSMRLVVLNDFVYTDNGLVVAQSTRPLGLSLVWAETMDGVVKTANVEGLSFSGTSLNVRFDLTPGERYSTIRLLVIG